MTTKLNLLGIIKLWLQKKVELSNRATQSLFIHLTTIPAMIMMEEEKWKKPKKH